MFPSHDTEITEDHIDIIVDANVKSIILSTQGEGDIDYNVIYNTLQKDTSNNGKEALEVIYRQLRNADPPDEETARGIIERLFFSDKRYDLGEVGRYRINQKLAIDTPMDVKVLTKEDIISIIRYLIELYNGSEILDDIDHLSIS